MKGLKAFTNVFFFLVMAPPFAQVKNIGDVLDYSLAPYIQPTNESHWLYLPQLLTTSPSIILVQITIIQRGGKISPPSF